MEEAIVEVLAVGMVAILEEVVVEEALEEVVIVEPPMVEVLAVLA